MSNYRIYGRPFTGSFAVEMLLTEMGRPYELVPISAEAAKAEAYRAICPTGLVPALALPDGAIVYESAAIMIHLTLAHPETGQAPTPGSAAHARFLQWMAYLSTTLYGACRRFYHSETIVGDDQAAQETVKAMAIADCLQAYRLLDEAAATTEGPGLLGALSAADFYLFMLLTWHPEGGEAAVTGAFARLADLATALRVRRALQALIAENAAPLPAG